MPLIATMPTALVLVDYQQRLLPAIHQAESVLAQATLLADVGRTLGWPVIGTEQNPRGLGPNAEAISSRCDVTMAKTHFDACADGLVELIQQRGRLVQASCAADPSKATPDQGAASNPALIREGVIAGCEAHVCPMQTSLGLIDAGQAEAAGNAYREYRRLQHAKRLSSNPKTPIPREEVETHISAVRALWEAVFSD